jgi:phage baseplate assembly protein W
MTPVYESAISLPFSFDNFGNVSSTISQPKIWADRVRSVIGTAIKERVMRPEYGTKIPRNLFDSVASVATLIQSEVEEAFGRYLPKLELEKTVVTIDEYNGTVYAEVNYFLPNKEQTSVTIGIATISSNSPIQEDIL